MRYALIVFFTALMLLVTSGCGKVEESAPSGGFLGALKSATEICAQKGGTEWMFNGPECGITGMHCVTENTFDDVEIESNSCISHLVRH